jgi:hypothetical protein
MKLLLPTECLGWMWWALKIRVYPETHDEGLKIVPLFHGILIWVYNGGAKRIIT